MANVRLRSEDPEIQVTGTLIGKPWLSPPRPKYQTQERPGQTSLTLYVGAEPFEMEIPLKFARRATSVEPRIHRLKSLALAHRWSGRFEPPIVKVGGVGVQSFEGLQWRIAEIVEDRERAIHLPDGERRVYVCTVKLLQRVADEVLSERLKAVLPANRDRGIVTRTTTVRAGETSLYDVARRVYRDASRASDIARANPKIVSLGSRLRAGLKLRLP